MNGTRHKLTRTAHPCWKCGTPLNHLEPAVDGWHYHCPTCQFLTTPHHEREKALAELIPGAIGLVVAVPCRIEVVPAEPDESSKGGEK